MSEPPEWIDNTLRRVGDVLVDQLEAADRLYRNGPGGDES